MYTDIQYHTHAHTYTHTVNISQFQPKLSASQSTMRTIVSYAWTWNEEPWFSSFNISNLKGNVKRFPLKKKNLSSLRRSWQQHKCLTLFYVSVLRLGNTFRCLLDFTLMWTVGRCSTSSASPRQSEFRKKPVKGHKLSLSSFKGLGSTTAHTSAQQLLRQALHLPCDQGERGDEANNKCSFPGSSHFFLE